MIMVEYAPGMRTIIRDEEWMVKKVEKNNMGNDVLYCVGVSPLVKDKEAIFLTDLEKVVIVDPKDIKLVVDNSSFFRRTQLYLESQWRQQIPTDTDLHIGDKVVTCMIFKDDPEITMFDLNKQNVGAADVYGLLPDDDYHLNGWFSNYIFIRGGSTVFNVSDLDLDSRILIEPSAVLVHAVERAKTTGILRFNSRVAVQGCGPIGLLCIAVLRTMGIENITAVDGNAQRLEFAGRMGANQTVNFNDHQGIEALTKAVEDSFGGHLADFAFQCTGNPKAHANIYKFIRNGGGLCELGFFVNGGDATINPHFDLCSKEINLVGSWVYTLRDYGTTFDFLKRAKGIGLPVTELITHKFPLDQINDALKTNLAMTGLKIAVITPPGA